MGETIILPQGEWLDNLVFAAKLLRTSSDLGAQRALSQIYHEIEIYSRRIYGHPIACSILEDAWLMRKLDPLVSFSGDNTWESLLDPGDWVEQEMIDTAMRNNDEAFEWFKHYHITPDKKQLYLKTNPIPLFQVVDFGRPEYVIFSPEVLRIIQQEILKRLHQKKIALESMPSSNIRISAYDSYRQHHLWRWLGFTKGDDPKDPYLPAVCIGSDDPGIFATNIKNEYLHIYYGLMQYWNLSRDDAFTHIVKLTENSSSYGFF